MYSADGDRWREADVDRSSNRILFPQAVAWGGGRFVAVGRSVTFLHSANGTRWREASGFVRGANLRGVTWGGDRFVAVGLSAGWGATIVHSADGDRWTEAFSFVSAPPWERGNVPGAVAWNGDRFVAAGERDTCAVPVAEVG